MVFKFNANDVQKPRAMGVQYEGLYNVVVDDAEYKEMSNGREGMTLNYKVLDGDQEGNMVYGDFMFMDPAHTEPGYFPHQKLNSWLKAVGAPEGYEFDFRDADKLIGKKLSIYVTFREEEYNGETNIRYNVASSQPLAEKSEPNMNKPRPIVSQNKQDVDVDPFAGGKEVNISDDDLPF